MAARQRSAEKAADKLPALIRAALAALILLSPLPFGAVQPWAVMAFELWAAGLGTAAVWVIYRDRSTLTPHARKLLLPVLLLLLLCMLQLIPLPHGIVNLLAAPTAEARDALAVVLPEAVSNLSPISASPPETLDALLRLIAYTCIGVAAAVCLRERRHLKLICTTIVLSALFQALYGSAEYLSGHQHIFGYSKKYYLDSATGTFINRNHFAAYLAMALPFALRAYFIRHESHQGEGWRRRLVLLLKPASMRRLLLAIAAFVIIAGVMLSYSRGGLAAALVGGVCLLLSTPRWRRRLPVLFLALLLPVAFLSWQEIKAPGARFLADSEEIYTLSSRLPVWHACADLLPPYLPAGSGFGTFEQVFDARKPAELQGRWTHAHNDWLQVLMEGGLLGFALIGWLTYIALARHKGSGIPLDRDPALRPNAIAAGIVAIAFHSAIDFPMRIPAVAILASCLIGMAASGYLQQAWSLPSLAERRRARRT